jgi:4-amino-4-deoxy-L-arabinose transferase-like glycosyltransferase
MDIAEPARLPDPEPAPEPAPPVGAARARRSIVARLRADPWTWLGLAGVATLALVLYGWGLTVSGYANTYYAMAAQAASQSWSAWFFGALDAGGFITLDKPPLSTMLLGLSVRVFGLSSWSILLPQALMGVATVVVLFLAVRRPFGPVAATIAGTVAALTPAAVLIFRFDNPDALLTLLLVSAAGALLRALEHGGMRWLVLAATLVGLGFMTKYLQAFLVLPVFALVWAFAAPGGWRRRGAGLAISAATVAVVGLAWPVAVELIPTTARPYIGGSETDSVVELIFGYDGLGRIFGGAGNGPGSVGGGLGGGLGGGGGFGGLPGLFRMANEQFGGQVAWLLPYALIALVAGLWIRGRRPRTDRPRASYLLWGGWLLVHVLVFSFMSGVIHPYYVVVMAPAIGALVGAGTVDLWRVRQRSLRRGRTGAAIVAGAVLGGALLIGGIWAWALLERTPGFAPGLGLAVVLVTAATAILLVIPVRTWRRLPAVALGLGLVALLAGPIAYARETMATAYSGGDPTAGPASARWLGGSAGAGGFIPGDRGLPGATDGAPDGIGSLPVPPGMGLAPGGGQLSGGDGGFPGAGGLAGGSGGPGEEADEALIAYLEANAGDARWVVAVSGSGTAAGIQLTTGLPVMTMGGFTGADPTPTLEELKAYLASGELRHVLLEGFGGGRGSAIGGAGGAGGAASVATWVAAECRSVELDGSASGLYDCAGAVTD